MIAAAMDAGIKVKFIVAKTLRKAKRFIIWDTRPRDCQKLPPNSIAFTTAFLDKKSPFVAEKMLDIDLVRKEANRILAHPTYVFGYNPHINVNIGIVGFGRVYCTTSTDPSIMILKYRTHIEYENFIQGLGRLSRNYDSGAIMITQGITQIAPLRFQPPKYKAPSNIYKAIEESYNGRSSPTVVVDPKWAPGLPHMFARISAEDEVDIGGRMYEVINKPHNCKSVFGITIIRPGCITGTYFSTTIPGSNVYGNAKLGFNPFLDLTTFA